MNENQKDVSFAAFESACTRLERANRRLFIVIILLLGALLAYQLEHSLKVDGICGPATRAELAK